MFLQKVITALNQKNTVKYFYHATTVKNFKTIRTHGLQPSEISLHSARRFKRAVYLTGKVKTAFSYARMRQTGHEDCSPYTVIIKIDANKLKKEKLKPDDFEFSGWCEKKGKDWKSASWEDSLKAVDQIVYQDIIKPSAFISYAVLRPGREREHEDLVWKPFSTLDPLSLFENEHDESVNRRKRETHV